MWHLPLHRKLHHAIILYPLCIAQVAPSAFSSLENFEPELGRSALDSDEVFVRLSWLLRLLFPVISSIVDDVPRCWVFNR